MNTIKFYDAKGQVYKATCNQGGQYPRKSMAHVTSMAFRQGLTRKRPTPPHSHAAQRPGYRQPTEQQLRRARQTIKKGRKH